MVKTKKIQIKDLQIGMKIKTKNEQSEIVFKTVTDKFNTVVNSNEQVRLEFDNGVVLNCSVNHPIMVLGEDGSFMQKKPEELSAEDRILTELGFTYLSKIIVGQNNDENYIDITVEDTHTFFASSSDDGPMVLTHNSQGGIRNASATVFYPIWHYQFDDLIVLKNNQGTDETRVRHLDYGVVLSAFFFRRFKNKQDITFFDPNEVPDLYEAFYSDMNKFEALYVKYEQDPKLRKKVISAEEVFKSGILKERTDTGRIYLVFIDNVLKQGPFDGKHHPIYQSNLCCLTGDAEIEIQYNGVICKIKMEEFVDNWSRGYYADDILVKSWDGDKIVWQNILNAILTKEVDELIEIETESGQVIRCTADHKIFTKNRGWVEAQDLTETDDLLID